MSTKTQIRTRAVVVVASLCCAQIVTAQSADARRMQRELEIMTGILETTLRFAAEESSEPQVYKWEALQRLTLAYPVGRSQSVRGYHLQDQGVVFVVKAGSHGGKLEYKTRIPVFEEVKYKEKLENILEERQATVKARLEAAMAHTDSIKQYLLEAVANHGDSMTMLAEEEYLNLIIEPSSSLGQFGVFLGGQSDSAAARTETLTIRKSWISDYKAGRLTLSQFKQKALAY